MPRSVHDAVDRRPPGTRPGGRRISMTRALAAGGAALVLSAAGCGPETDNGARDPRSGTEVDAMERSTAEDSLEFVIEAPRRVSPGEPVPIVLRVTNVETDSVTLHLLGRTIAFDIIVRDDGEVVWRRLEGEVLPAILQIRTLAPGESLELRDRWNQRTNAGAAAAPGRYTIQGELPTDAPEPLRTARVPLVIEES